MSQELNLSNHIYLIEAERKTSQFDQNRQNMRCRIVSVHRDHMVVESLKRYNIKYPNSNRSTNTKLLGRPIRRINVDQAIKIVDESTGRILTWDTVRRREGTLESPGRSRGGK